MKIRTSHISDAVVEAVQLHQKVHTLDAYGMPACSLVPAPAPAKRILVIQPSSIGDVLYVTPALQALREQNPDAWIGHIVEDDAAAALEGGVPDHLFVANRREWLDQGEGARPAIRKFLEGLADAGIDLVLNPHATARSAWYATVAARERAPILGLSFRAGGKAQLTGNAYHYRWIARLTPVPAITAPDGVPILLGTAADLARRMGLGRCRPRIRMALSEDDRRDASAFLSGAGVAADARLIAVHTGSKSDQRRWRRDRWPACVDEIARRSGRPVIFIGGPADVERQSWIREKLAAPVLDATAKGNLRFTAALLERADLLVGPDTGTTHLAAAVGCPTLTITGPRWVGAYAARSLVISGPAEPAWCGTLEPGTVSDAAAFMLGAGSMPALPPGFSASWTGDTPPCEFFREVHPGRVRAGDEHAQCVLGLAWENVIAGIGGSWNYPATGIESSEAKLWLGPPDAAARLQIEKRLTSLIEWKRDVAWLRTEFESVRSGGRRGPARQVDMSAGFWPRFFKPLDFDRRAVEASPDDHAAILKLYLEAIRRTKEFLEGVFES